MKKIAMIGTGAYGLGVSIALLKKNESITMWVESEERAKFLNNNKKNANILPNIEIPKNITFTNDLNEVISNTNIVFIAVAAKYIDSVAKDLSKLNIVAISDRKFLGCDIKQVQNFELVSPNKIKLCDYDLILISLKQFDNIKKSLRNQGLKKPIYGIIKGVK